MATSDDDVTAVNDDEEVFDDTDVVATPSVAMLVMRVVVGISVAMRVVVGISVAMRVVVVLFVAMLVIAKYILRYYHKQREIYTCIHVDIIIVHNHVYQIREKHGLLPRVY